MDNAAKPGLGRILEVDYGAAVCLLALVAVWGLYGLARLVGSQPGGWTLSLGLALLATIICIAAAGLRVVAIGGLFARGQPVPGKVEGVGFFRDRGRVEFSYEFGGECLRAGSAIMKGKRTEALKRGQAVTVMVDPANPKKAMIRELFL